LILEILFGFAVTLPFTSALASHFAEAMAGPPPVLKELPYDPPEQVELIAGLLDESEAWTFVPSKADKRVTTYAHESGVQVYKDGSTLICDSEGTYKGVELTARDRQHLAAKRASAISRAKDREQANLTRTLAQRLVNLADGKVDPVLGNAGVPRLPSSSEDDSVGGLDPVSTGTLTYDPVSRQVLAIGGDGTGRIVMSDELANRYGLLASRLTVDCIRTDCLTRGSGLQRLADLRNKLRRDTLSVEEKLEFAKLHKRAQKEHWYL